MTKQEQSVKYDVVAPLRQYVCRTNSPMEGYSDIAIDRLSYPNSPQEKENDQL